MHVQLTDAAVAALTASGGQPITLTSYKLGSAYNYIPAPSDTDIHGSLIFSGVPSAPTAQNANIVRYAIYLDYNLGDWQFGEVGIYMQNGDLFALAASDELIQKLSLATSNMNANSIRLDMYLSMVGDNYDMWLDLAESNNKFQVARLGSVDQLPPPEKATPNMYVITGASSNQSGFLAFTDRLGLWNFDAYAYANQFGGTITGSDNTSVTIDISEYSTDLIPGYFGQRILEFSTGPLYGICRYIQSVVVSGSTVRLNFQTGIAMTPNIGDKFIVFSRTPLANSNVDLPIASTTQLGAIIIGNGLVADANGVTSVDPTQLQLYLVTSVNGETGDVVINANNLPGLAQVAKTGQWSDLLGKPSVFTPPIASNTTLGGVRIPTGGSFSINPANGDLSLTFTPVTSVNGQTGDVTIPVTATPIALASGADLNLYTAAGVVFAATDAIAVSLVNAPTFSVPRTEATVEIVPINDDGSGDVVQRWTQKDRIAWRVLQGTTWTAWYDPSAAGLPIATNIALGAIMVGAGLNIDGSGVLSTQIQAVNGKTDQFVILNAEDVGAVSASDIGRQGGVAGPLSEDPVDPPPDENVSDYTYGRLPQEQLPLGAFYYFLEWNANTNSATYTDEQSIVHTVALADDGMMTDSWNDGAAQSMTVPANGKVFKVSVAGSTALDGISAWSVNDLAIAVGDQWLKFGSAASVSGTFTLASNGTYMFTMPSGFDPMDVILQLKVQDTGTPTNWYDASAVATVTYTSTGGIMVTNNASTSLNFRYIMRA